MRMLSTAFVCALLVAPTAHAQSTTDLQAQLNALLSQLSALQAQLGQTSTPATSAPPVQTSSGRDACPSLSRPLRAGMSGADVSALQTFLAADSTIYAEGTVSGYFGSLTQRAVQRFQAKHGIVNGGSPDATGFGMVGPTTRATILTLCQGGISTPVAQTPAGSCTLGGITVAQGNTHTFYSTTEAPLGTTCDAYAATRQCSNGVFSGNAAYQYRSCVESEAASCRVDGERVAHGTSFTYYSKRTVSSAGETCAQFSQTRTCTNGELSGSSEFDKISCSAAECALDGARIAHGSSSVFYLAQNIPATEQCASYAQTRTCSLGTLSGNTSYKYRSCARVSGGACALDNVVIPSGSATAFYSAASAPVGTTCASIRQSRSCTNGTLSGSATYNRASCSDTASCSLDGTTVAHGAKATFYSAKTVAYGTTCSSKAQQRTCTNGKLSGGATYQYASCSVNPPTSALPENAQLAAALTALESLLKSALTQLDSWL